MLTLNSRRDAEASTVALRRSVPQLYIVDVACRVVLGSSDETGERLAPPVEAIVRKILERVTRAGNATYGQTDGTYFVRVAPLTGQLGDYFGVVVERFRPRETLRKAATTYGLTRREGEVLGLLVAGLSTAETAAKLQVAKSTVILHVKSLLAKSGTHSRTELLGKILAADGS